MRVRPMSFHTQPNPDQPDRCPSIDPHDELQCGRRIHDDDQCVFGGIAWRKGTPRYVSDRERAQTAEATLARVEAALARHPEACTKHPEGDVVSCGWKRAVLDVRAALDGVA